MATNISTVSLVRSLRDKLSGDPPPPSEKILRILQKLAHLPISIDVLHETGIGKVVNGFRKHDGEIAQSARGLVRHWKSMVHEAMGEQAMKQDGAVRQNQSSRELKTPSSIRDKVASRPLSHVKTTDESSSPYDNTIASPAFESLTKPQTPSQTPTKIKSSTAVLKSLDHSSKSKSIPRNTSSSHSSSSSVVSTKSLVKKQPREEDDVHDGKYTQLKEKHSSVTSGSPVKKLESIHQNPGNGTANVLVRRENDIAGERSDHRSSSGQKKIIKESRSSVKPHDRSHDRSHDNGATTSGVKQSSELKSKSHAGLNPEPNEKHLTPTIQKPSPGKSFPSHRTERDDKSPQHRKSSHDPKDKSIEKATRHPSDTTIKKNVEKSKSNESSSQSNAHRNKTAIKGKSVKVATQGSSDKAPPRISKIQGESSSRSQVGSSDKKRKKKKPEEKLLGDNEVNDEEPGGQDFRSTGMSFGDCLFVPVASKLKKVSTNKSSINSSTSAKPGSDCTTTKALPVKMKDKSKITHTSSSDSRSKVKGSHSDSSKPSVKGESSKSRDKGSSQVKEGDQTKTHDRKGTSSSEGQSSDAGQGSEKGRRHRKKRSMSEEDEEAMIAKKLRRESAEVELSLPEIQPNYKPMRLPEMPSPLKKRVMTAEEERAFLGSKQGKTKVFSGRSRVNRLTSVPKLYNICMDILCDNIDALDEVGGVPYDILHPVLQRCTPEQLFHLEDCNPHFLDDTDPLWQKHAQRDYKGEMPSEMESWRELYIRQHDEREKRLKSITANISRQMAEKDPGRLTKMAFLDRPAKPPRSVMRQQQRHGTASGAFMPEKRTHSTVQPNRLSRVLINSSGADVSSDPTQHHRQARATKIVAPMMMKTMRMIKKLRR